MSNGILSTVVGTSLDLPTGLFVDESNNDVYISDRVSFSIFLFKNVYIFNNLSNYFNRLVLLEKFLKDFYQSMLVRLTMQYIQSLEMFLSAIQLQFFKLMMEFLLLTLKVAWSDLSNFPAQLDTMDWTVNITTVLELAA